MTLPMFFSAAGALQAASTNPNEPFVLSGDEGRHAVSVKRIQVGEQVLIADGDNSGFVAQCIVTELRGKDKLVLRLETWQEDDVRTSLTVVLALIKGERMERAIEQLTEVGVGTIIPWASERSVVSLKGGAGNKIHKRLERKAFEAAKQCRQPTVPKISEPMTTAELNAFLNERQETARIVVLHEEADWGLEERFPSKQGRGESLDKTVLIVGPEGGLTKEEVANFKKLGGKTAVLGRTIMRAGTAAVVAAGWLIGSSGLWDMRHMADYSEADDSVWDNE